MFDLVLGHTSFLGHTGYANHAREFFSELGNKIPVRIRNFAHVSDIGYLTDKQKNMLVEQTWEQEPYKVGSPFNREEYKNVVDLVLVETNHYYFYDTYPGPKIAYNVWESTRQPEGFFSCLLGYDQLWVPSQWQRQCSIEQGFPSDKVKVVPEGVNGAIFKPVPSYERVSSGKFRFAYFGRWDYRKSTTEVIKAFIDEFKPDEPVELLLSVDNPFSLDEYKTTEERLIGYNLCQPDDPRLVIVHFPPFKEYIRLLQNSNCFVSCARSEGWNLPLIEAIACGVPSICSNYGAQLEFAQGIATTVNIAGHKPPEQVFMQDTNVPGTWAEPDFEHLRKVMREVYNNYDAHMARAIQGSKVVRDTFSWSKAAKIGYDYIEELGKVSVPVSETKLKLNLGCGAEKLDGYVNIDKYVKTADKNMDMIELEYTDMSVDEIRSVHALEHLSKADARKAIRSWYAKLKPGGSVDICVPDLTWILTEWLRKAPEEREGFALDTIFGNQEHEGEFHKTGFSRESLEELLKSVGFVNIDIKQTWSHGQQSLQAKATKGEAHGREIIVVGGYPDTPEKENILRTCFTRLKGSGLDVAFVTHYPINSSLAGIFDYVIYERANVLSGDWDLNYWFVIPDKLRILTKYGNGNYQPVAILSSWRSAIACLSDKYDMMYYVESDTMVNVLEFTKEARQARAEGYKCLLLPYNTIETVNGVTTNAFACDLNWANEMLPKLSSWQEYLELNDSMLRAGVHNGDAMFELWFGNYLGYVGKRDSCKVLTDDDRKRIIITGNAITRDKVEFRAFFSETDDHRVLLFVINTTETKTKDIKIWFNDSIVETISLSAGNAYWRVFAKDKGVVKVESEEKEVILNIDPLVTYTDSTFSFKNGEFKCLKWSGGAYDEITKDLHLSAGFIRGPKLEITGPSDNRLYDFNFIDEEEEQLVYTTRLPKNHWAVANRKYYTKWRLEIGLDGNVLLAHRFDPTGRKVFVVIDSKSLGDTIAWIPYAQEFKDVHGCKVVVSSFWNKLFSPVYPDIEFVEPGAVVHDLYAAFYVGCYDGNAEENKNDWRTIPMQQIATDVLGLEYKEIKPRIIGKDSLRVIDKPYVCISEHSTAQAKYWTYPGGWQKIVDYLKQKGYEVVVVSRESTKLQGVVRNTNKSIEETIASIANCEFYMGVGSGPSWLAWALDKQVVMISGFSEPFCEFQSNITRIINKDVCHGCFNDPTIVFDRGDWLWCPREKDFECTKSITPEMVMEGIECLVG